jgi:hypothetical protein
MEAFAGLLEASAQSQEPQDFTHSRRRRRRIEARPRNLASLESGLRWLQPPKLGASQTAFLAGVSYAPHVNKLEELKSRRFTALGREERIARSLAALQQQSTIQLTPIEWQSIIENSEIEDDFE